MLTLRTTTMHLDRNPGEFILKQDTGASTVTLTQIAEDGTETSMTFTLGEAEALGGYLKALSE